MDQIFMAKQQEPFFKDEQITPDVDPNKDAPLSKDLYKHDPLVTKDTEAKDPHLKETFVAAAEHLNKNSPHATDEHGSKKGGKFKEKVHRKKEKLKEKLGLKKDEETKGGEVKEVAKGHEIATIKIPGIESGDRAAQDMVNQQAKAKKELNAELKEHAGHSDHLAPSEIVSHGITHTLPESRAVETLLSMPDQGLTDPVLREQVIAKSELNSEIKTYAGEKKRLH